MEDQEKLSTARLRAANTFPTSVSGEPVRRSSGSLVSGNAGCEGWTVGSVPRLRVGARRLARRLCRWALVLARQLAAGRKDLGGSGQDAGSAQRLVMTRIRSPADFD